MAPWWKTSIAYQIYPRSFADASGDGIGDLAGLRQHLDHLAWLGVDAIWLSPVYPSPMADFGYDVADYCGVDPLFGTLEDLDGLIVDLHGRGMKLILDWVPNHTSDRHPWFLASRAARDDPHRDWYIWRDPAPDGGPPNNWIAAFAPVPAWTYDEGTGQYYLHCFLPEQPDLNWANPAVVEAMHDTLRFWLDRGVDGFRMDVVHLIGKDPDLADDPPEVAGLPHVVLNHRPETHDLLRGIRALLDSYPGDRMAIGEVYLLDTRMVASYYGAGDELHLNFNFPPLYASWDAATWRDQIQRVEAELGRLDAWPTWVLSNHDNRRHRSRYGRDGAARAAAVLLLTLRGTPFLYAGEELGLEDAAVPPERTVDPGGRDGCRAPFPWDGTPAHGWPADPWLPFAPDVAHRNAATEAADPASIANLYRRAIALRRATPPLRAGAIELLDAPAGVVAFRRTLDGDARVVAVNFTDQRCTDVPLTGTVELSSAGAGERAGRRFDGVLDPDEAVVLRDQ